MVRILTQNYEEFLEAKNKSFASFSARDFWESRHSWRLINVLPARYEKQKKFLNDKLIPLLRGGDIVCDFACACGDFSFQIAHFVKHVDGFDISAQMIEKATKTAEENNIKNASFKCSDASEMVFDKIYDAFMMLGLLTYIFETKDVVEIIHKVNRSIKKGGYLVLKDTLTLKNAPYYYFTDHSGNNSIIRPKAGYIKLFTDNGFDLVCEELLSENDSLPDNERDAAIVSMGLLFRKNDNI